jgi:hypothetical protein
MSEAETSEAGALGISVRAMKSETSRLWIGGWVAMALFCGAAGCSDDDDGGGETPGPDAGGDVASDGPPRVDVASDATSETRADASDGSPTSDARDSMTEPTIDRADVGGNDATDATDATDVATDAVIDVPVTPPTGFSITGIAGPADTTADAWLMGTPNPVVQWGAAMGAQSYEVTVYEEDGTTVKCAAQQEPATATSSSFANCALTEGLQYRASVVATAGTFRTAAMNDKFKFAVGAVVWGQVDAKTHAGARLGLASPSDITFAGGKMMVADQINHRVLVWNAVPASNHQPADLVLGQPDFTTSVANYGGIGASSFNSSNGVASNGTQLVVGDRLNNRILIWNTFPTTHHQPASVVLGQPNFTTGTRNTGGVTATSMSEPWVWLCGNKLVASDRQNARVLIWNAIPTVNTAPADVVLGQPSMTSNTPNNGGTIDNTSVAEPGRGWCDGTKLYVPDLQNHRVLIWNTVPTTNNTGADLVLGQSSMSLNSANAGQASINNTGLDQPIAVYANGNTIAVADGLNNRVAVWTMPVAGNGQPANVFLGQSTPATGGPNAGGVTASSLSAPYSVGGDGTRLAIIDRGNNRIVMYPTMPAADGAPASVFVGQPDSVSSRMNNGGPITASALNAPGAIAMLGNRFAVSDTGASRVLVWNAAPGSRTDAPAIALGQPNFTSYGPFGNTASSTSMCSPNSIHSDGTRFFVGEQCHNRVTVWNALPTATQQPADVVLGQMDMTGSMSNAGGVSGSSLFGRQSVHSDGTRLFVADEANHRVLIWNAMPTMNRKAADLVLGQANLNANTENSGGVNATSLARPSGITVSGTKVIVADSSNGRILIWNTIPTTDRATADVVLGQPNMTTGTPATSVSAQTLNLPTNLHVDASGRLYVADTGNNRILYWNTIPTMNQAPADGVIGQPNMMSALANNGGLGARTLEGPSAIMSSGQLLYLSDSGNDRMLLMPRP